MIHIYESSWLTVLRGWRLVTVVLSWLPLIQLTMKTEPNKTHSLHWYGMVPYHTTTITTRPSLCGTEAGSRVIQITVHFLLRNIVLLFGISTPTP
jgi:hypothetical protein